MAQFEYLGTWVDSFEILKILINNNSLTLIGNLWYEKNDTSGLYVITENNDESRNYIKKYRNLFIWDKSITKFPPMLVKQNSGPKAGWHRLSYQRGGPMLDLTFPGCSQSDDSINLSIGILACPPYYENPETKEMEKTPNDVKVLFKLLCKDIKRQLVRYKHNIYIWTGKDAVRLLGEGKARITSLGV
jgi:hypothetical protein